MVTPGKKVNHFSRPATGNKVISLKDLSGKNVVLYFYPKDNTPGCTTEGLDFSAAKARFTRQNTVILGVSRDSIKKHENFKNKQKFNFDLLSDEDESLCQQFGVIQLKKLYGKEYMGIVRSTFLIDKKGIMIEEWRNIKVKDHVETVLTACKNLNT